MACRAPEGHSPSPQPSWTRTNSRSTPRPRDSWPSLTGGTVRRGVFTSWGGAGRARAGDQSPSCAQSRPPGIVILVPQVAEANSQALSTESYSLTSSSASESSFPWNAMPDCNKPCMLDPHSRAGQSLAIRVTAGKWDLGTSHTVYRFGEVAQEPGARTSHLPWGSSERSESTSARCNRFDQSFRPCQHSFSL